MGLLLNGKLHATSSKGAHYILAPALVGIVCMYLYVYGCMYVCMYVIILYIYLQVWVA